MAAESKPNSNNNNNKKRKQRYLPHNKSVRKGSYPLHPGVQGFFLTCDGGRERQAAHEAINVIDNFYEELVHHGNSLAKLAILPDKPQNKIIKFSDSDSSSDDDGDDGDNKSDCHKEDDSDHANLVNAKADSCKKVDADHGNEVVETIQTTAKKQRIETDALKNGNATCGETEEKSIDRLIEAELKELGDRNKRRFVSLDSSCNGVVFVKMHKIDGDPGPAEIVQHMMTSAASTRKHMSRFILRVLPVEVACYASEEEISKAIKPLITLHFPAEAPNPQKFAVLYEARANTGIERMSIINSIAKSVPGPHKVDLNNPDKTIIVQIVKTVCLIGVVEKYKELAKYNLRQLTSPKP